MQFLRAGMRSPTWRSLLAYARPHRTALVLGGILGLLGSLTGLVQPLAAGAIIDALGSGNPILPLVAALTALVVVGSVLGAVGQYILGRTDQSVVRAAREQLIGRILRLRVSAMEGAQPGDLMSRVTSDTTVLQRATTHALIQVAIGLITMLGIIVMMAIMDVVLLGVVLVVLVLSFSVIQGFLPRVREATRQAQEATGAMGSSLERALGAFRTVKAYGAESQEAAGIERNISTAWRNGVEVAKWNALLGSIVGVAIQLSFLAVLGVGGARVAAGDIPVSTLVAFLLYLFYLMSPVSNLMSAALQFQSGAAAIGRINEVQEMEVEPAAVAQANEAMPREPATVAFQHVVFRYRAEMPDVHAGVTFDIPAGGITALVGASGAGKSTVFSLLERFYEPGSGVILFDGRDLQDYSLPTLREAIGYAEQDAPVLAGTLRENLLFGKADATDEEIGRAVHLARLDTLIDRLPEGLETVVGHRGTTLSGGERQRVAIARALLRQPRLLLLDEVTSQLDAQNEAALRESIVAVAQETTVLVIAHRLSTVVNADRIIVMEAGRVRAIGRHGELAQTDSLYRELAATQLLAPTEAISRMQ